VANAYKSKRNEECSNQNSSLISLQMTMLQKVKVKSPSEHLTFLCSAVHIAVVYGFAMYLMLAVW
jgi:hypothetical protein